MPAVIPAVRTTRTAARPRPATVNTLAVILGVLAIGAAQGGITMILDPVAPWGMSVTFLDRTPIETYFWPGVFLLGIAAASLVTALGLMSGWKWGWAAGIESAIAHRWPWLGALAVGAVLLAFELVELFMVPFHPVMHPLLIAVSLAIIGLALTRSARSFLAADLAPN